MYWFRSKNLKKGLLCGLVLTVLITACKPAIKPGTAGLKYFDLNGFFKKDSARLAQADKPVYKTIKHNGITETHRVRIDNWGTELSLFRESDINRPAWKNSYKITANSNIIIYQAKEPDLKTREILIRKANGKVISILIVNDTKNVLYQTQEKLSYFPDSMYLIQKAQKVRFLGVNKYDIKGLLK